MTWLTERRTGADRFRTCLLTALVSAAVAASRSAHAVIIFGGDGRNTTAPPGALADSGWQYEGQWGLFLGTPIGPNHFLTANHVGGAIGETFTFQGTNYSAREKTSIAGTDLAIWRVDGVFSTYAPLYTGSNETGADLTVFGRGGPRDGEVRVDGTPKGWYTGAYDGLQSWGTNQVSEITNVDAQQGAALGDLVTWTFDQTGGPNEAFLSGGDSGGSVFVRDTDGVFRLAGINFAIEAFYSFAGNDTDKFTAAIYDGRGLYRGDNNQYDYLAPGLPDPVPSHAYATRVSSHFAAIRAIVPQAGPGSGGAAIPEPGTLALLVGTGPLAAAVVFVRRRRCRNE